MKSETTSSQAVPSADTSSIIMAKSKWQMISYYTFDNNCITFVEPLMIDLQKIVIPKIMIKWEELAVALNFDNQMIAAIKQKEHDDPNKCCRKFFIDWLETGHGTNPKQWSTLFKVLKDPDLKLVEQSTLEDMVTKVMQLEY